jgi:hypothetical protein
VNGSLVSPQPSHSVFSPRTPDSLRVHTCVDGEHLFYSLYILQLEHSMSIACLLISHFIRNGIAVDDLGLLLVISAVIILIPGVIFYAAVGQFVQGPPVI